MWVYSIYMCVWVGGCVCVYIYIWTRVWPPTRPSAFPLKALPPSPPPVKAFTAAFRLPLKALPPSPPSR